MEARAVTRNVQISPRKARLIADLIRGKEAEEALNVLAYAPQKAARLLSKTLKSAVANAADTQHVDVDNLYVKRVYIDGGMMGKRFIPRAHGRATRVRKRTSHFTIVVDERR